MAVGYIKLYRKIQSNDLWRKETFNYASAWIDLLLSANWQDGYFRPGFHFDQGTG